MKLAGVVSVFVAFCSCFVVTESSNLTANPASSAKRPRLRLRFKIPSVVKPAAVRRKPTLNVTKPQSADALTVGQAAAEGFKAYDQWETGWFVAGCYADIVNDRDLPVGPHSVVSSDPYPICASYCMDKGNRYAGLQLSPDDPSAVLCYCGLTVGRHGGSRRCTVRCPGSITEDQVCGNKLVNLVIFVYRVRRSNFEELYIGTSALLIVILMVVNTAVMAGCTVYLIVTARRMVNVK